METARLGPLTVSRIALGAMLMGGKTPVDESHRMLDRFVDAGGTLVDTADVYGDGTSERVLAPWLARRRDDVVLATKLRYEVAGVPARASRPTASARPAMPASSASASTSSTSTRSTRRTRTSRSRRRSRR